MMPNFVFAQTAKEIEYEYPNKEIVRVMSYNVWCGYENLKDVNRMNNAIKWIKEKDPEVVALQELCGFNQTKLEKFAKQYGHPYALIQKENGYPVGITSKHPIKKIFIRKEGMGHGFIHVQTYGMDMIVLHLTPFNCNNRLREAKLVTDYIHKNKLDHCLVMGDFNSHSPFDAEELEQHTELIKGLAVYAEKYKKNANVRGNNLDYSIQGNMLATPLEDVIRLFVPVKKRMTYPAFTFTKIYKGKNVQIQSGERIDYIYCSPALTSSCINAYVWNGDDTRFLSDHYPIGIDMLRNK